MVGGGSALLCVHEGSPATKQSEGVEARAAQYALYTRAAPAQPSAARLLAIHLCRGKGVGGRLALLLRARVALALQRKYGLQKAYQQGHRCRLREARRPRGVHQGGVPLQSESWLFSSGCCYFCYGCCCRWC